MIEPNTLLEKICLGEDSTRRQLRSKQLARLFQQRSQTGLIRFDEELIPMATLADLVESLWQRFRPARIQEPAEATLRKLGLARQDEEGGWRPTVSGILMASSDPRRHLPNAFIQAVAYRGKTVAPEVAGISINSMPRTSPARWMRR